MRRLAHLLIPCACVVVLASVGCKSKPAGFVGTWQTTTSAQDGTESTMTFNSDQTMSFTASNAPKQSPYKLTGMGTWKATDKELTVTPAAMNLEMKDETA